MTAESFSQSVARRIVGIIEESGLYVGDVEDQAAVEQYTLELALLGEPLMLDDAIAISQVLGVELSEVMIAALGRDDTKVKS